VRCLVFRTFDPSAETSSLQNVHPGHHRRSVFRLSSTSTARMRMGRVAGVRGVFGWEPEPSRRRAPGTASKTVLRHVTVVHRVGRARFETCPPTGDCGERNRTTRQKLMVCGMRSSMRHETSFQYPHDEPYPPRMKSNVRTCYRSPAASRLPRLASTCMHKIPVLSSVPRAVGWAAEPPEVHVLSPKTLPSFRRCTSSWRAATWSHIASAGPGQASAA
jgi:hypothetical protein